MKVPAEVAGTHDPFQHFKRLARGCRRALAATSAGNLRERDRAHRALGARRRLERIQRIAGVGPVSKSISVTASRTAAPPNSPGSGLPPAAANEATRNGSVESIRGSRANWPASVRVLKRESEDYSAEYRIVRPNDGTTRWIRVVAKIERDSDGRALRLVGADCDVTPQMLAQATLRESEERFRLIADSAPVPIWVTKLDRTRSFANQAYVDFLGLPYDEAIVFNWRERLHPDDQQSVVQESIAGEASLRPFVLEARFQRGDGEWRWLRSISQPRWGPAGEHIGFIGVAHDITEAKQARTICAVNEISNCGSPRDRAARIQRSPDAGDLRDQPSVSEPAQPARRRPVCQQDGARRNLRGRQRGDRPSVLGNAVVFRH